MAANTAEQSSGSTPASPGQRYLIVRFAHLHYVLNALLALPLPVLLSYHLWVLNLSTGLDRNTLLAILAAPSLMGLSVMTSRWDFAEALFESVCWNLKVFNAFGLFFTRANLGLSSAPAASYLVAWLLISFFFPQPSYLGPSHLQPLNSEEFDELVAIVPPALPLDLSASNPIIELPSPESYEARRRSSTVYSVVLFHADWSRKSRELEITLSRLSSQYASPSLAFYLLTPDLAPQTFYDLSLSIQPTSLDLPALLLFRRGKVIARLPKGIDEVGEERRREKMGKREKEREKREREGRGEESESGSEEDGSDEERENEKRVAVERYRWDRSGRSIVEAFKLKERSGLFTNKTT